LTPLTQALHICHHPLLGHNGASWLLVFLAYSGLPWPFGLGCISSLPCYARGSSLLCLKIKKKERLHGLAFQVTSPLTPKGPKAIFRPFLKFGQAVVKAIFFQNS
jgi:hypothetical protein